jgi:hypothetical protein
MQYIKKTGRDIIDNSECRIQNAELLPQKKLPILNLAYRQAGSPF